MKKMFFRRSIFVLLFCLSFIIFQPEKVFATEQKHPSLPITCNIAGVVQSISVLRQTTYGTAEFMNTYNIYSVSLKVTNASDLAEKANIYDVNAIKARAKNKDNSISTSTPCSTIINTEQRIIIKDIPANEKLPFSQGQKIKGDINYYIDYFDNTYYYYAFEVKLVDKNNNEIDSDSIRKLIKKHKIILVQSVEEDDGKYVVSGVRSAKLFGIFPVKIETIVKMQANFKGDISTNHESIDGPWWKIFVTK
jgi:hypothetical protein